MAADNEFHALLYAAADKHDLWTLVRSRSGHIDRLRRLHLPSAGKAQDIVRHHKLIVKAIADGKPDEAQNHCGPICRARSASSPGFARGIRNTSATETRLPCCLGCERDTSAHYRAQPRYWRRRLPLGNPGAGNRLHGQPVSI